VNVLILGGTGFIGPHVVGRLVDQGHRVALFNRGQTAASVSAAVIHILGERQRLRDFAPRFEAFSPRIVLDMFAYTAEDARAVVQTLRGLAERLICVSSMDVYRAYGSFFADWKPVHQIPGHLMKPRRCGGFSIRIVLSRRHRTIFFIIGDKILVEQIVTHEPDLPATLLRLPQVFGPHDPQHRLAAYLRAMDEGDEILLDEGKAQWRWTRGYVEEVAHAISLAVTEARAAGRIYNVGESEARTEIEWVRKIAQIAGWRGEVKIVSKSFQVSVNSAFSRAV
jgi:nucleoside-diphosphate-sugar epimerase